MYTRLYISIIHIPAYPYILYIPAMCDASSRIVVSVSVHACDASERSTATTTTRARAHTHVLHLAL
jgi:hypothetical protein